MALELVHCVSTLEVFAKSKVFEYPLLTYCRYYNLFFVRIQPFFDAVNQKIQNIRAISCAQCNVVDKS